MDLFQRAMGDSTCLRGMTVLPIVAVDNDYFRYFPPPSFLSLASRTTVRKRTESTPLQQLELGQVSWRPQLNGPASYA
jgi:hypothetical protein